MKSLWWQRLEGTAWPGANEPCKARLVWTMARYYSSRIGTRQSIWMSLCSNAAVTYFKLPSVQARMDSLEVMIWNIKGSLWVLHVLESSETDILHFCQQLWVGELAIRWLHVSSFFFFVLHVLSVLHLYFIHRKRMCVASPTMLVGVMLWLLPTLPLFSSSQ